MLINDYMLAEEVDKLKWLNSIKMKVGLPYFGGKSRIGKYLFNNIFNLAVQMKKDEKPADIFVDAFTGGGKMGLSVPVGWFNTIVMNDLDYGVYSFYKCCQNDYIIDKEEKSKNKENEEEKEQVKVEQEEDKERQEKKDKHNNYIKLIYMIEEIGKIMCADLFYEAAWIRKFGPGADKYNEKDNPNPVQDDEIIEPVVAAALTYWVTSSSYNCQTDPKSTSYNIASELKDSTSNRIEKQNITKIVERARKVIPKIHDQLNKHNYIIENLDYRELIKKYNGLPYIDLTGKEYKADESLKEKNKLWYFDPPYHPDTLYGGEDAPYALTFTKKLANEMVDVLSNKMISTYGELFYFIKSDYDPKETVARAEANIDSETDNNLLEWYRDVINNKDSLKKTFEDLEQHPYMKICVGSFDKGTMVFNDDVGVWERSVGKEYIWTRGFSKEYQDIEGVEATS